MSNIDYNQFFDYMIEPMKALFKRSNCVFSSENLKKDKREGKYDQFYLRMQYADLYIKMLIIYQNEVHPPMIFFIDNNDFVVDLNKIDSLKNWNPKNSDSLHLVLSDLLYNQFLIHNEEKLKKFNKKNVYNEYIQLKQKYKRENVQCYVNNTFDYACVSLVLKFDSSNLTNDNKDLQSFSLMLKYVHFRDKKEINIDYEFSDSLKKYLDYHKIHLPNYDNNCMSEYSELVETHIADFLCLLKENLHKRKAYITEFKKEFQYCLIEYDSKFYEMVSILVSHEDFYCVLTVKLDNSFPLSAPIIILYSIYHVTQNRLPFKQIIPETNYNSKWSYGEMVVNFKRDLIDMIASFKETSMKAGKLN